MDLHTIVETSRAVAGTRSRLKKRAALARCLVQAAPGERVLVVNYLRGTLRQGRIGLGPRLLRSASAVEPARRPSLDLVETDRVFEEIASYRGTGSQAARRQSLERLFSRATVEERDFLSRLALGELRQGALDSALTDAVAEAANIQDAEVRRAVMLAGDLVPVAEAVLAEGRRALSRFRLEPLSPVQPMLAQPAEDIDEALGSLGEAALEFKLDGARVQIHKADAEVRIFSRGLNDVTGRLPELVEAIRPLPTDRLILDGEVIAMRDDGRPHPFQVTMQRFGRSRDDAELRGRIPLSVFLFDCLHAGGEDLIDMPAMERFRRLEPLAQDLLVPRIVTADPRLAEQFFIRALDAGHEGVMAKSLSGAYAAGSRGADWLKVKQAHTLDLVVLAAEWGSGRRRGWLSNLHLGARDEIAGGFVMLGKTFKGLTDRLLQWQTGELMSREIARQGSTVHVRPELVVEIAVNEIQSSPHYPAGMALRFARVKRYRPDKRPEEADTVETVREMFERQSGVR